MLKRISMSIVIAALLIPSVAQAKKSNSSQIAPSTPRQFSSSMALPGAGGAELTIVATAADEGRANAAISSALSQAAAAAGALTSEVQNINEQPRKTPVTISDKLFGVLDRCIAFSALTDGAFDITGAGDETKPELAKGNWRRLKLKKSDLTLTIKSDDLGIDSTTFGLALRGFIADEVTENLRTQGWTNAQIRIGNVTRNIGRDIHTPWTIRLEAPTEAERNKHAFRAYDYSVGDIATATISPRLFPQGIIDPRSRTVVDNPAVINTIIFASDAAMASAYAIATYTNSVSKIEQGLKFIQSHPEVRGIVIALDGTVMGTSGLGINKPAPTETPQVTADK